MNGVVMRFTKYSAPKWNIEYSLADEPTLGWRLSNDRRSWTWFEVGGNIAPRRHIVHNIPASWERRVHRTQWDNSLHDGSPEDAQLLEWMSSIAGGQEVSVFARAQFRGWENHVHRVIIEVYCACV